jgi:hypothetical protein
MVTLFIILLGVYAICGVGYYKIIMKAAGAEEFGITAPAKMLSYFFAAIWPLMVTVTMLRESVS